MDLEDAAWRCDGLVDGVRHSCLRILDGEPLPGGAELPLRCTDWLSNAHTKLRTLWGKRPLIICLLNDAQK